MCERHEYKGYEFKIESVNNNSPYTAPNLDEFWYKSIIIPPEGKLKRCLNIKFHDTEFTLDYINENGVFMMHVKVKCNIRVRKDEGYITLEVYDKQLRRKDYILEKVSRKLIDHIESVLDLRVDSENNNSIKKNKIDNLDEDTNENIVPTFNFHQLLLKHIVNSENPNGEIKRIIKTLNIIKKIYRIK